MLGLGRLGAAVARRLAGEGWDVVGWSRSGRAVDGVPAAASAAEAVTGASYVVLVLYDGPACREVLDGLGEDLAPATVVVNLSTVGPDDARALAELVRRRGGGYLHAPVLGSVGPALAGRLTILAGAPTGPTAADDLLASLGTVLPADDPARAAAAKLVANGTLANAVLAVRDGLRAGAELGLPPGLALDLLERTALGGLVSGKRSRLAGRAAPAEFAIGALRKDVALLAQHAGPGRALRARLDGLDGPHAEADLAELARPLPAPDAPLLAGADGRSEELLAPLLAYARGHATGDPAHFREAFLPSAHVEGIRDGAFVSWDLDEYCALFAGHPAADEPSRRRTLDALTVTGTVGHALMTLEHGPDTFADQFLLVRTPAGWRIANKVYDRR